MSDKSIRFINSRYDEQFRIPDGGTVEVTYPDWTFVQKCRYFDEYHFSLGPDVYHICQFAELLERNGGTVRPEPISMEQEGAWKIGVRDHLLIQESENGWDYSFYGRDLKLIDGGVIDDPSLTINGAREEVLSHLVMSNRRREPENYERICERIDARERESITAQLAELRKTLPARDGPARGEEPSR